MGRTSFAEPDSHVVVSSDGYFDVFAPGTRAENDKPGTTGWQILKPLARES